MLVFSWAPFTSKMETIAGILVVILGCILAGTCFGFTHGHVFGEATTVTGSV